MRKNKIIKLNLKKFIRSIVIIVGLTVFLTFIATRSIYSYQKPEIKTVYIKDGDTLWNIAENEQKNNSYYNNKSIRDIVYDIKKTNNMKSGTIRAGEIIKIYYR